MKKASKSWRLFFILDEMTNYLALSSSIAAWAAARRATGTRNGEQLT